MFKWTLAGDYARVDTDDNKKGGYMACCDTLKCYGGQDPALGTGGQATPWRYNTGSNQVTLNQAGAALPAWTATSAARSCSVRRSASLLPWSCARLRDFRCSLRVVRCMRAHARLLVACPHSDSSVMYVAGTNNGVKGVFSVDLVTIDPLSAVFTATSGYSAMTVVAHPGMIGRFFVAHCGTGCEILRCVLRAVGVLPCAEWRWCPRFPCLPLPLSSVLRLGVLCSLASLSCALLFLSVEKGVSTFIAGNKDSAVSSLPFSLLCLSMLQIPMLLMPLQGTSDGVGSAAKFSAAPWQLAIGPRP
jgi:hypothetical protein